jgi:hypothetical protein
VAFSSSRAIRTGILAWYRDHLHVAVQDFGASFRWRDEHVPERRGATIWGVFDADRATSRRATSPTC